ncbi:CotH kinase family protein [Caballeronia sp. GAWG2-1]|uniref:CotH kinase family protein n=1 Tax=Caballeronia sp. GAWG2-1 TaxID=2921744 RepID=UPI002028114B|nr:CotH kinase family protein [Caballeronia sp. GAWG2-1]
MMLQFVVEAKTRSRPSLASMAAVVLISTVLAACSGGGSSAPSKDSTDTTDPSGKSATPAAALPAMSINMDGRVPIVDKHVYLGADLGITGPDDVDPFTGRTSIKGHGNSTWTADKKPYRLKLDSKASFFGLPKDKNWILLANYFDKTLLRNRTAFELGRRFGMAWTPHDVPVELTLNGQYAGVYDVVESVRVDKNRVNIANSDNVVAPESTGFLVEINERMDEDVCWRTTHGIALCIDSPDSASDAQVAFIKDYMQQAEDALFSDARNYEQYFDVASLIDWYLVNEIFKNQDARDFASIYLYKDASGKLKFGPLWDFDIGAGNINFSDAQYPEGWWVANGQWISRMKQIDPSFETRVRARWDQLKASQIDTIVSYVDENAQALQANGAAKRNFDKWPVLGKKLWPNPVVTGTYQGEVAYLKDWLTRRIAWLDGNL